MLFNYYFEVESFFVFFSICLDLVISIVSKPFDLILLGFFGYLGFLGFVGFSLISLSISLFSVSISEILNQYLLDSLFQGDLSSTISSGFSLLSDFFVRCLLDLVVVVWMLGVCCCLGCLCLVCFWVFRFVNL